MKVGKRGDTLVEVALAVGIFSLVAISTAAVLSSSTAGAQTALETTVTREEIDTQAEALRYIQTAYAINRTDTENNKFYQLWKTITGNAIVLSNLTDSQKTAFLEYNPTSCSDLYNSAKTIGYDKAFIINPKKLGDFTTSSIDSAYISSSTGRLQPATIYPRLIYQGSNSATTSGTQDAIIDTNPNANLFRAEGIYVVAVRDAKTNLTDITGSQTSTSAFYDFYIRSCWYGIDADQPSTISTVIRLFDPDVLTGNGTVIVYTHCDPYTGDICGTRRGRRVTLPTPPARLGYTFNWAGGGESYPGGTVLTNDDGGVKVYDLSANWDHTEYKINYLLKYPYASYDSSMNLPAQTCHQDDGVAPSTRPACRLATANASSRPTASGYKLIGWCSNGVVDKPTAQNDSSCTNGGKFYALDYTFPTGTNFPTAVFAGAGRTLYLHAVWKENNETIKAVLTWGASPSDLDSYVTGQKSDSTYFTAYFGSMVGSDTSGLTIAKLDQDVTSGYGPETMIINTLGGKNYYYSVRNYSSDSNIAGATVQVYVDGVLAKTYSSNNASGNGRVWNVFAYKDGQIVDRQTRSAEAQNNY